MRIRKEERNLSSLKRYQTEVGDRKRRSSSNRQIQHTVILAR